MAQRGEITKVAKITIKLGYLTGREFPLVNWIKGLVTSEVAGLNPSKLEHVTFVYIMVYLW